MSGETNYLSGPKNVITNEVINKVCCLSKTGDNIALIPLSASIPIIRCVEDGDIFKQNRFYGLKADQSGYDSVFPMHKHDPEEEFNDGGSLYDVEALNNRYVLDFDNRTFLKSGFLIEADEAVDTVILDRRPTGEGSMYVQGTSNDVAGAKKGFNFFRGGQRLDFSAPAIFTIKMALSHATALVFRAGVNMTTVQNIDGGQNQFGIEGCTSSSPNFQVVSGNGASRTGLPLPNAALNYADPKGYKLEYVPGNKVVITDGLGNSITKDDIFPTLNAGSDGDATLRIGLITSDNISKVGKFFASRLLGKVFDINPAIGAWL